MFNETLRLEVWIWPWGWESCWLWLKTPSSLGTHLNPETFRPSLKVIYPCLHYRSNLVFFYIQIWHTWNHGFVAGKAERQHNFRSRPCACADDVRSSASPSSVTKAQKKKKKKKTAEFWGPRKTQKNSHQQQILMAHWRIASLQLSWRPTLPQLSIWSGFHQRRTWGLTTMLNWPEACASIQYTILAVGRLFGMKVGWTERQISDEWIKAEIHLQASRYPDRNIHARYSTI